MNRQLSWCNGNKMCTQLASLLSNCYVNRDIFHALLPCSQNGLKFFAYEIPALPSCKLNKFPCPEHVTVDICVYSKSHSVVQSLCYSSLRTLCEVIVVSLMPSKISIHKNEALAVAHHWPSKWKYC